MHKKHSSLAQNICDNWTMCMFKSNWRQMLCKSSIAAFWMKIRIKNINLRIMHVKVGYFFKITDLVYSFVMATPFVEKSYEKTGKFCKPRSIWRFFQIFDISLQSGVMWFSFVSLQKNLTVRDKTSHTSQHLCNKKYNLLIHVHKHLLLWNQM